MIAAKILDGGCGMWHAWMGVDLEHIRKDVRLSGNRFLTETLVEILLEDVQHMDCYPDACEVIRAVERQHQGQEVPFSPGTTAYSLGVLVSEPA